MNARFSLSILLVVVLALLAAAPMQAQSAGILVAPGSLDASFSGDGKATGGWAAFNDGATAIAIQRDGKIVMAGYTEYSDGDEDFMVLRYNADGSPDSSFGLMGMVMTSFDSLNIDRANAVAIQPDGKILAAGYVYASGLADIAVARYNSNGSLDTTFDGDGMAVISISSDDDMAAAMVIQPDGKILLAGSTYIGSYQFALVRLNSNGSLDTTFDGDGKVYTVVGANYDYGRAVALQNDGKILVAGYSYSIDTQDISLVRYNSNGSLDTTFCGDGRLLTDITADDRAYAVAVQADGKIVVGGVAMYASGRDFILARYLSNGSLDLSFGVNGISSADICGSSEEMSAISIQPDGMIFMAGYCATSPTDDFILVRFNREGGLDASFDGDGKTMTDFSGNLDRGNAIALQPDGKVIVVGEAVVGGQNDFGMARYWGNSYLYLPALRK
ncbi:MAG: hypothetical protein JXB15_00850 [Anaerolineales bacterium]|nr:hypothetical protein [Anaerolineales bacterium]